MSGDGILYVAGMAIRPRSRNTRRMALDPGVFATTGAARISSSSTVPSSRRSSLRSWIARAGREHA